MQAFKLAINLTGFLIKLLIKTSRKGLETAQQNIQDIAMVWKAEPQLHNFA